MAALCNKSKKQQTIKLTKKTNNKLKRINSFKISCNYSKQELKFHLVKLLLKQQNLVFKQPSLIFPQRPLNKKTTAVKATRTSITTTSKTTIT